MSFNNPNDDNIDELTVERLEADLGRRMDALTAARER